MNTWYDVVKILLQKGNVINVINVVRYRFFNIFSAYLRATRDSWTTRFSIVRIFKDTIHKTHNRVIKSPRNIMNLRLSMYSHRQYRVSLCNRYAHLIYNARMTVISKIWILNNFSPWIEKFYWNIQLFNQIGKLW